MSGTAFGTIVLHVSPDSAVGGPLALVHTGDRITLDVAARRISLDVSDTELARRRTALESIGTPPPPPRGYARLYHSHVTQAEDGCDFDFMAPAVQRGVTPL